MNCLIHLFTACIFDPSGLYITGHIEAARPVVTFQKDFHDGNGPIYTKEGAWCQTHYCRGPVGELRIGVATEITRSFTLDMGVLHRSYIAERKDRGFEVPYVSLTWRPFK